MSRATPCFELALTRVRRCRSGSLSLIVKALIIRMKQFWDRNVFQSWRHAALSATIEVMGSIPESTKGSLQSRLSARARDRWPALTHVTVRYRGGFAYVTGHLPGDEELPLCRLRYGGSASMWGFAIYRASHEDYEDSYLPDGSTAGTPEAGFDTACGLYLADPTAWT